MQLEFLNCLTFGTSGGEVHLINSEQAYIHRPGVSEPGKNTKPSGNIWDVGFSILLHRRQCCDSALFILSINC